MSCGSLDYCEGKILGIVRGIESRIDADGREIEHKYDLLTVQILERAATLGREFAILAHEAEWLFSGDTDNESFQQRVANKLENLKRRVTK